MVRARAARPASARRTTPTTRCGGRRRSPSPRRPRGTGPSGRCASDGRPRSTGFSGKLTALKPRARRCGGCRAPRPRGRRATGSAAGSKRSGAGPTHSSMCQSFHARRRSETELGIRALANVVPGEPGDEDGKHSDAHTPSTSMSAMRASRSQQPRRMSAKFAGSIDPLLCGPTDDRVEPDLRMPAARRRPTPPVPSSATSIVGARSARRAGRRPTKTSGGSTR